jgi:hypothetical protein
MIPKSAKRFSEKVMRSKKSMISKSVKRFSDEVMLD